MHQHESHCDGSGESGSYLPLVPAHTIGDVLKRTFSSNPPLPREFVHCTFTRTKEPLAVFRDVKRASFSEPRIFILLVTRTLRPSATPLNITYTKTVD